jgi:hypothetical protein
MKTMSIKRLPIPDAMFWDLKKISYERGMRVSDVAVEAYQDYIEKNKHLLNQKIILNHSYKAERRRDSTNWIY